MNTNKNALPAPRVAPALTAGFCEHAEADKPMVPVDLRRDQDVVDPCSADRQSRINAALRKTTRLN